MRICTLRTLFLGLLIATALPAAAQQIDSTLVARFQLADTYLRAGQFDRSISLLEDLYAESPSTYVFYEKLKEAYESVKRYEDAIRLVDDRIAREDAPVVLTAQKARLYYLMGDEAQALATWDAAVALEPGKATAYRVVYQSLVEVRLFEQAVAVLEKGRDVLGDAALFRMDLAYMYSLTGRHADAMTEYLGLLDESDRQLSFVRSRLGRFVEQEGVLEASIPVAEEAVRKTPLNRSYRELLGWLYIEADRFSDAFNTYRAIDRLEQENGNVLFGFAEQAADAAAYKVASDAYREILERYPDSPAAADAQFGLGSMLEKQAEDLGERAVDDAGNRRPAPRYEEALAAYQLFLKKYATHPYYPEVLGRIGQLQLDVFFDLDAAETAYAEVTAIYGSSEAADEAAFDTGRIALMRGDLDGARLIFSKLVDRLRIGELAERARYEMAMLHFYRGEFEAALTISAPMNENTSTDVANDAIELKVMLIENKGPDSLNSALRMYARSALALRQRHFNEALATLDSLLQDYGTHPLADEARYSRARALRQAGRAEDALAALLEFPLIHPTSYLTDRSLFEAADIYEFELGNDDEAVTLYARLLTEYPGSLLGPRARERIRFLRGDGI
ncbi:MAG: tetratricopeptide repeat protein [Rhodothermales bacterium]